MKMRIDGLTLDDIAQIDPRKLDTETLKSLTQRIAWEANRRIKRLEKSGLMKYSPAYKYLRSGEKHKGKVQKFSSKIAKPTTKREQKRKEKMGKNYERLKLLTEYSRASEFLFDKKTGGVMGTKKMMKDIEDQFTGYYDLKKSQRKDFWDAYHRLLTTPEGSLIVKKSNDGGAMTSTDAQRILYEDMFGDKSARPPADEAITRLQKALEVAYEEKMREQIENERDNALDTDVGSDEDPDDEY